MTRIWTSLVRTGMVSAEDALKYWKFMIGPQSPFRNLDAKMSIVYDDKDKPLAYQVELTKDTCLLTLHSLFVSSRLPLERPGCIFLYNSLIKAGVSEVDARFLMFNFEADSDDHDCAIHIAGHGHFAFCPLRFLYDYFVNGSSPQSSTRVGGNYFGNHANFMKKKVTVDYSSYATYPYATYPKNVIGMLKLISGEKEPYGKVFKKYRASNDKLVRGNTYGSTPPLIMNALAANADRFIEAYKREIG